MTRTVRKAKDNGEKQKAANEQAATIIQKVQEDVSKLHEVGHKIKELRDSGMAWWAIGYELGLEGSAPNVKDGKGGASRARTLYKKTFGALPGDKAPRASKARRAAAAEEGGAVPVRRPVFTEGSSDEEVINRVAGHLIKWIGRTECSDGSTIVVEREARVHPDEVIVERPEGKPARISFREYEKGDRRAQQFRCVNVLDVFDVRK